MTQTQKFSFTGLTLSRIHEAVDILANGFSKRIAYNVDKVGLEIYKPYIEKLINSSIDQELSIMVIENKTDKMVCVFINHDCTFSMDRTDLPTTSYRDAVIAQAKATFGSFFKENENLAPGEMVEFNMIASAEGYEGLGLITQTTKHSIDLCRKRGYKTAVVLAANPVTRSIMERKFNEIVRNENDICTSDPDNFGYLGSYKMAFLTIDL